MFLPNLGEVWLNYFLYFSLFCSSPSGTLINVFHRNSVQQATGALFHFVVVDDDLFSSLLDSITLYYDLL